MYTLDLHTQLLCLPVLLCILLWETTLNPETRRMKRVEIEDARLASSVTEVLMGSEVPPRKAFIYEHAADAELDV